MARRQISSSFSVCQLGFLGGVFGCYCMAGMTKTYVSRSWYLICSRTKTLMTFVRVWASANACFSLFTVPKLSSCYVFLMHPCCFCLAVMTTTYISRCWNIIVLDCSRTKFWWALCVSEPVHLYSLCEQYDPYLLSMVYPFRTRAQLCFSGSLVVTICLSNDASGCMFPVFFR